MTETKKLLFSVTANDCEWSYTKGSGAGGQKRNKTSSAVHCKHIASGATGYSENTRSQRQNKESAFKRELYTILHIFYLTLFLFIGKILP